MKTTDYLFDPRPFSASSTRRVIPLTRPRRSKIDSNVWEALLRVKAAIDETAKERGRR